MMLDDDGAVETFLSSLEFAPLDERPEFLLWREEFPIVIQVDALELAMKAWFHRLRPEAVRSPCKENQPMLMTSAPTGSGKTVFLRLLCQLFRKKWDVDSFLSSLLPVPDSKEECGDYIEEDEDEDEDNFSSKSRDAWLQKLSETLNKFKESLKSKKLIPLRSKLAQSFLTSTHACFVSFNSTSPMTDFEIAKLGKSPELMLIARIIFAELKTVDYPSSTGWVARYDQFLKRHGDTILRFHPSSALRSAISFIRRKFNCEHYILALDEVVLLNELPTDTCSPQQQDNYERRSASTGLGKVLTMVGRMVMSHPWCAAIVSSLVTDPLGEYVAESQQDHAFIPLHPFLDQLGHLAQFIVEKRGVPESRPAVLRMLVASGGHPMLLSKIMSWLSSSYVTCDEMTLLTAARICGVSRDKLFDPQIAESIFKGTPLPEKEVATMSGLAGMLTRPTSVSTPFVIVVAPLVLYLIAANHPAMRGKRTGEERVLEANTLVPTEIRSGEIFESFVATWLTFRLRLSGDTLGSLLMCQGDSMGGAEVVSTSLNVRKLKRIHAFRNWSAFLEALPSEEKDLRVFLEMAQRPGEPRLFGMGRGTISNQYNAAPMRVAMPFNRSNPGFDVAVGRCVGDDKRVLLIQCKTQEADTSETGGKGQRFGSKELAATIRQCDNTVTDFVTQGYKVSLLILAACLTSANVVSNCPITSEDSPSVHSLFERTGVIGMAGLRDLFGPSFALAQELAEGRPFILSTAASNDEEEEGKMQLL